MTVLVFTDFDGVLTGYNGQFVVQSQFYDTFFEDRNLHLLKPLEEMVTLLQRHFRDKDDAHPDRQFLIQPAAIRFLKEALRSDQIQIIIITANEIPYLQALFTYHEFSREEMERLVFKTGDKGMVVSDYLSPEFGSTVLQPRHIAVLDDEEVHVRGMISALTAMFHGDDGFSRYQHQPGTFPWERIGQDIMARSRTSSLPLIRRILVSPSLSLMPDPALSPLMRRRERLALHPDLADRPSADSTPHVSAVTKKNNG